MLLKVISLTLLTSVVFNINIGRENCVSVWTFCYDSMEIDMERNGSFNNQSESGYLD